MLDFSYPYLCQLTVTSLRLNFHLWLSPGNNYGNYGILSIMLLQIQWLTSTSNFAPCQLRNPTTSTFRFILIDLYWLIASSKPSQKSCETFTSMFQPDAWLILSWWQVFRNSAVKVSVSTCSGCLGYGQRKKSKWDRWTGLDGFRLFLECDPKVNLWADFIRSKSWSQARQKVVGSPKLSLGLELTIISASIMNPTATWRL